MKYIEFGFSNTWLLRTETESEGGTEIEEKGVVGPIKVQSAYIRIWIFKTVIVLDSQEGFKRTKKNHNKCKLLIGVVST